jgi:hypothetical protein
MKQHYTTYFTNFVFRTCNQHFGTKRKHLHYKTVERIPDITLNKTTLWAIEWLIKGVRAIFVSTSHQEFSISMESTSTVQLPIMWGGSSRKKMKCVASLVPYHWSVHVGEENCVGNHDWGIRKWEIIRQMIMT